MEKVGWSTSPEDAYNIINLPLKDLKIIYQDYKPETLVRTKRKLRKKLREGRLTIMPANPEYQNPEAEREAATARRRKAAPKVGRTAVGSTITITVPEEHAVYHNELQEALNEHGALNRASFTDWQGFIKNDDGEPEIVDLHRKRFDVKFSSEPQWPIPTRVESVVLPKKESKKAPEATRSAIVLPDLQIPFHDERAVSVALQIVRDVKPDKVVLLGDALDLSAWSKYIQRPEWATATQGAIIELHKLLATLRKMVPTAEIAVLAGNHELRLGNNLLQNAMAAYGLKRADDLEGWPVMSVPYLCAFDQLGVDYYDGYPANRYWINERLQVRHGHITRSNGSTAQAVSSDERVSTIVGHTHRLEAHYKTVNVYNGGRINAAFSAGCLCRIDGAVPSTKGGVDQRTGQHVTNYENWQNGLIVTSYQEGDGPFSVTPVFINTFDGYATQFNGKTYRP